MLNTIPDLKRVHNVIVFGKIARYMGTCRTALTHKQALTPRVHLYSEQRRNRPETTSALFAAARSPAVDIKNSSIGFRCTSLYPYVNVV